MIKVNFKEPTLVVIDDEITSVMFLFCNGVLFYDDNDFYHRINSDKLSASNGLLCQIDSIEHVKPTDL